MKIEVQDDPDWVNRIFYNRKSKLSVLDLRLLVSLAKGGESKTIAKEEGRSVTCIADRRKALFRRLKVKSANEAIGKAFVLGHIYFTEKVETNESSTAAIDPNED